ncbi:DUF955 domain-containing protein (plasmid) [Halolamina sp. CBA1230]|uniref:ArdC-like ssDNA-binding domain-containing protein n=1 Tax=Halolamina sp. CBA1230 TaxID=1853690 RepID=UPI0009A23CC2|nr:ArdC-like ssDNA-binding domain-containing protein [Halolamina sp. CBA1230]QKY22205.1 DUF955 domain-containing protein [Halolamina sp. CBA1230]
MMTSSESGVSFEETDTRHDEMHSTIEDWIDELVADVDEAKASQQFQEWLDVQSRFHDYSYRNTLLIKLQCPEATRVAGYNTWRSEFDRHVQEGEQAIWIWAPIITKQCPECENSPSYHKQSDCDYDETPPEEWSEGLVGFKPTAVFDVSQTEGEPLPELETEAAGDADDLVPALRDAAATLDIDVRVVDAAEWEHGDAKGVCKHRNLHECQPVVEAKDRANQADLAVTLIHEYAHALLHFDVVDEPERAKREIEAEAVAYIVGRYFDLDTSGSAFYLAAWQDDDAESIQERLGRISSTAQEIIGTVAES